MVLYNDMLIVYHGITKYGDACDDMYSINANDIIKQNGNTVIWRKIDIQIPWIPNLVLVSDNLALYGFGGNVNKQHNSLLIHENFDGLLTYLSKSIKYIIIYFDIH